MQPFEELPEIPLANDGKSAYPTPHLSMIGETGGMTASGSGMQMEGDKNMTGSHFNMN